MHQAFIKITRYKCDIYYKTAFIIVLIAFCQQYALRIFLNYSH